MGWVEGRGGRWEGGRVWEESDGSRSFVIRRQIGGKRYEVATGCDRERPALAQLDRFLADPEGYDPRGGQREPLYITAALVKAFLAHSRDARENSAGWRRQQKAYLAWWSGKLKGRDLRRLSLSEHIVPALDGAPETRHRKEVLKAFCTWLRTERHLLDRREDVTLDLTVPARKPSQRKKSKVISREDFAAVLLAIEPKHRDALNLMDATGWHVTELERFARTGEIQAAPEGSDAAAVLETRQKSGDPDRKSVDAATLALARKVRARGSFSTPRFYEAIKVACGKAGVSWTPGRIRHTVATRLVNEGASVPDVVSYMGWKSAATMRRHYTTLAAPPKPKRR